MSMNFMTPEQLSITAPQHAALVKTLALMETGKMLHVNKERISEKAGEVFTGHFNMNVWNRVSHCGTVCCIGGTAELVGNTLFPIPINVQLEDLFYPPVAECRYETYDNITVEEAAQALRNYLTGGDPMWWQVLGTKKEETTS
jgi:hypothetical protein